ncbi:MAG: hypothetical protein ACLGJC_23695 [Alphaproteobacteria bacterium]
MQDGVLLAVGILPPPPAAQADPNASLMLGALTTMATTAVSYWVGRSAGSAAKGKLLRGRSREVEGLPEVQGKWPSLCSNISSTFSTAFSHCCPFAELGPIEW